MHLCYSSVQAALAPVVRVYVVTSCRNSSAVCLTVLVGAVSLKGRLKSLSVFRGTRTAPSPPPPAPSPPAPRDADTIKPMNFNPSYL
ncbi:unnamed protein product [Danaus chrysippus]|uniref:(African queen) hypothetical protein n=1 Tax=Danaus chrysippus TaxID=151541 RepID=A0A8J2RCP4_9NEOP|nr:unnamed protein product [Danaus chrysippus]